MERKEIVFDGSAAHSAEEFFEEARRALTAADCDVPCRNLSALADLLRGGFGVHAYGQPIAVRWTHARAARTALGHETAARYWERVSRRCHSSRREEIAARAEAAARGEGPTFFETVCAILFDRRNADCTVTFVEEE